MHNITAVTVFTHTHAHTRTQYKSLWAEGPPQPDSSYSSSLDMNNA